MDNVIPTLAPWERSNLKESIQQWGILIPIVLDQEGNIVDGNHRLELWEELGEGNRGPRDEYPTEVIDVHGDDERNLFAKIINVIRRQLSPEQVTSFYDDAWEIAKRLRAEGYSQADAAKTVGVSREFVKKREDEERVNSENKSKKKAQKEIEKSGDIEKAATKAGVTSETVEDWKQEAFKMESIGTRTNALQIEQPDLRVKIPKSEYGRIWEMRKEQNISATQIAEEYKVSRQTISGIIGSITREKNKQAKIDALEKEDIPLPGGRFHVIVVDPPWRYRQRQEDTSHRARSPYPDKSTEEICALDVASLAEDDCILWLWTTNAHILRDASQVLDAWGFQEKTILTWEKHHYGTGDWLRGQTEHCILAVKGKPIMSDKRQATGTIIHGKLREHSRKPEEFYELVESLCPGSKVELFARQTREGWGQHGLELGEFDEEK